MKERQEGTEEGRGISAGPVCAGVVTTAGLVGFIASLGVGDEQKASYIAIVLTAAFAAYIVRFFLRLFEWHIRQHDRLSAQAHAEQCQTLREIRNTLSVMNGHLREGGGQRNEHKGKA